jgi:hypothetical protein
LSALLTIELTISVIKQRQTPVAGIWKWTIAAIQALSFSGGGSSVQDVMYPVRRCAHVRLITRAGVSLVLLVATASVNLAYLKGNAAFIGNLFKFLVFGSGNTVAVRLQIPSTAPFIYVS